MRGAYGYLYGAWPSSNERGRKMVNNDGGGVVILAAVVGRWPVFVAGRREREG